MIEEHSLVVMVGILGEGQEGVRGKRYTIEGALCLNGLLAYAIQEGPMNSNDYNYFIEHILVIFTIMFINVLFIYYILKNIFFFIEAS